MNNWIDYISSCLSEDTTLPDFLLALEEGLKYVDDKATACYRCAEWLQKQYHPYFAAVIYEKAGKFFIADHDGCNAFISHLNAGLLQEYIGESELAYTIFQKTENLLQLHNESWTLSQIQSKILLDLNFSITLEKLGLYDEVLEKYEELKSLCHKEKDWNALMRCYIGEANIHRTLGNFPLSFRTYDEAYKLAEIQNDALHKARAKHGQCNLLIEYAELEKAIEVGRRAQEFYEQADDKMGLTEMFLILGDIYHTLADAPFIMMEMGKSALLKVAREYYELALHNATPNDPVNSCDAFIKLAVLYQHEGDYKAAKGLYDELIMEPLLKTDYYLAQQFWHGLGDLHLEQQQYKKALSAYKNGLELAQKNADQEGLSKWKFLIGYMYEKESKTDIAIDHYKTAIDIQESLGKTIVEDRYAVGYFSIRVDVYHKILNLLLTTNQYSNAFHYLERSKAKAFLKLLHHRDEQKYQSKALNFNETACLLL